MLRFTPTCVGTTGARAWANLRPAVHPHMRGDNLYVAIVLAWIAGSPPHAWGQLRSDTAHPTDIRFTPTCMGTTPGSCGSLRNQSVHPHMHGDNGDANTYSDPFGGSPPHAWGQRRMRWTTRGGKTVHPHMHGDNETAFPPGPPDNGSPPHAWGQRCRRRAQESSSRFTPTCMGTTLDRTAIYLSPVFKTTEKCQATNTCY